VLRLDDAVTAVRAELAARIAFAVAAVVDAVVALLAGFDDAVLPGARERENGQEYGWTKCGRIPLRIAKARVKGARDPPP
jgi:hypothetical protein